jgi:outer membrane protein, heavy metal efflux system
MTFLLLALAINFNDRGAVIETALASSPTVGRLRAEAAAARERVGPAAALPNPMVMAGVRDRQIDLSDDPMMTMYMVGASQTITRPSKRDARRNAAELEARAAELQLDSARAEIERDVLLSWWDVAAADAQIRTAEAVRELIDAVVAAARVRYEVGSAAQADVIRAQLQASELDHEILSLRGARRVAAARLLPLLGLPPETEIPALTLPEESASLSISAPSTPPADHPGLAALELMVEAQEETIRLMRLELKPDIDVEAQYGFRRREKDTISVIARIELPFLNRDKTIEPRVREAIALRDAARLRIDELRRSLTGQMAVAAAEHAEATEQMQLHHQVLVPQAKLAFDSTLAAYQTGNAPFDAILTTKTDYLRLNLQYYELLARHAQAVVTFEALRRGAGSMQ